MGRLSNRDVDALIQAEYEDALADDLPWARDAYEARRAESADRRQAKGRGTSLSPLRLAPMTGASHDRTQPDPKEVT